jgi:DsbC/DsbD-like thiol-disulfide interchange protein
MILKHLLALVLAIACLSHPARAVTQDDVLSAEVLPGWRTEQGTRMAALRLTLAPGWKTYWRSPGDAGIPPLFNWSGSQNLAGVRVHWPRPIVFEMNGYRSIGYKHEVVLPLELTATDPSQPILLQAEIDLGICRDICMPAALTFQSRISGAGAPDAAIRAALNDRPATAAEAGLGGIGCTVEPIPDGLRLTARLALPPTGGTETVVFEPGPASIWVSEAVVSRDGAHLVATADLVSGDGGPVLLNRGAMVVTVLGQERAVEIAGCPSP